MNTPGEPLRAVQSPDGDARARTVGYGTPRTAADDGPAVEAGAAILGGRYRVLGLLGAGGMGVVYLAERVDDGTRVALKVMRPEFAADEVLCERLRREALAVRRIAHPGVVALLDDGQDPALGPWLAFECLTGESLAERLAARGAMSIGDALACADEMLDALESAHEAGVVHRDLKPENVLLVHDARVARGERAMLVDFGISRIALDASAYGLDKLTRTGSVVGTPMYMPPEQALGEREQDARVDVYSAGVVLYELLSGGVPHPGTNYNHVLSHVLNKEPEPLQRHAPAVDGALAAIVHRAIAHDPDARYATARAFREALRTYRAALERECARETQPASAPTESYAQARRRVHAVLPRAVVGGLAAAMFLASVGAALTRPSRAQASDAPAMQAMRPAVRLGAALAARESIADVATAVAPAVAVTSHVGIRTTSRAASLRGPVFGDPRALAIVGGGPIGSRSALRIRVANPYRAR